MRLLVSVRDVGEALAAAAAGADFIDLKEPRAGALGALPLTVIRDIVAAVRRAHPGRPISATVGDFAPDAVEPVLERVQATAGCGVDYVKVGIARGAERLLDALGGSADRVVPVFIADAGLDEAMIARACERGFTALMIDTADKAGGSLFDMADHDALRRVVRAARRHGLPCGLAGALRQRDLPRLTALAPDFAGFRGAVCSGARSGRLDPQRVGALRAALAAPCSGGADRAADQAA